MLVTAILVCCSTCWGHFIIIPDNYCINLAQKAWDQLYKNRFLIIADKVLELLVIGTVWVIFVGGILRSHLLTLIQKQMGTLYQK